MYGIFEGGEDQPSHSHALIHKDLENASVYKDAH